MKNLKIIGLTLFIMCQEMLRSQMQLILLSVKINMVKQQSIQVVHFLILFMNIATAKTLFTIMTCLTEELRQ